MRKKSSPIKTLLAILGEALGKLPPVERRRILKQGRKLLADRRAYKLKHGHFPPVLP